MSKHVSAMGKVVDMNALRAKNEKVRAVGNMRVNARGDTIDSNDNVIQDNTKRVNEQYMKAVVSTRQAPMKPQPTASALTPDVVAPVTEQVEPQEAYKSMDDFDDDIPNPKKKK
jgi:hypothetical protein